MKKMVNYINFKFRKNFSTKTAYPSPFKSNFKPNSIFNSQFDPKYSGFLTNKKSNRLSIMNSLYTFEENLPQINTSNTQLKRQELINKIENEYYQSLKENINTNEQLSYQKEIPKMGDYIDLEYYISVSSGKINKLRGYVISTKNNDSYKFSFTIFFYEGGSYGELSLCLHSPIVKTVKIIKREAYDLPDTMINKKKLRYFGHMNKLFLKSGKLNKITKKERLKVKEYMRNEEINEIMDE